MNAPDAKDSPGPERVALAPRMSSARPTAAVHPWENRGAMLGVDEARARILTGFAPLPPVSIPLLDALGLVLAEEVVATVTIPPFPNSAMDGFAVRAGDTAGASPAMPVRLRVVGEAPAGVTPSVTVGPGTAVRIMTGAPIPAGADAVVRFEETDEGEPRAPHDGHAGATIGIRRAARLAEHIRAAGEDVRAGDQVLTPGTRLRPAELGLLAALGRTHVVVHRRPRVAILATGDEVVDPGTPLGSGQIRDSNSVTVAAIVRRCGGEPVQLGIARDRVGELVAKLEMARSADLLITTGGVSGGDYDLVKDVLRREGRIALWQVRLKPGKPLAFGWIGALPLLGLPGNPVAAAVACELFARPVILTLLGRTELTIPTVQARLGDRVENRGGRRHYVRVRVTATPEGYTARVAGAQGAGILSALAAANGLLVVPEDVGVAQPGDVLPVQMLDWEVG